MTTVDGVITANVGWLFGPGRLELTGLPDRDAGHDMDPSLDGTDLRATSAAAREAPAQLMGGFVTEQA